MRIRPLIKRRQCEVLKGTGAAALNNPVPHSKAVSAPWYNRDGVSSIKQKASLAWCRTSSHDADRQNQFQEYEPSHCDGYTTLMPVTIELTVPQLFATGILNSFVANLHIVQKSLLDRFLLNYMINLHLKIQLCVLRIF